MAWDKNKEDPLTTVATNSIGPGPSRDQRLINTEVFDPEFYAAQCGHVFQSTRLAAKHFVQFGMKSGLSLHPLFDLSYFPKSVRDRFHSADVEFILDYLKSEESRQHAWSAIFDPSQLPENGSINSRLLSRYRLTTNPPLPVPKTFLGTAPSWSEARTILMSHARVSRSYVMAKKPLRYKHWPEKVETDWIHLIEGQPGVEYTPGQPAVSIIMPAYNREIAIRTAIDSVRRQTFDAWELIVVDDGSTDQTREVVRAYSLIDDRITLVETEHKGVCAARNVGIKSASAKYLAFLDSDNTWRPEFLKYMVSGLRYENSKAAYSAIRMINDREEYTGQTVDSTKLIIRNFVDLNVLVVETDLIRQIGGFDEKLRRWVDHDLVLRIIQESPIAYFPFIGCDYFDADDEDRITRTESTNWQYAVLGKNLVNWIGPDIFYEQIDPSPLAIVIHVSSNPLRALANLRSLIDLNRVKPSDIVVVEEISDYKKSLAFRAAVSGLTGIKYIKLPREYTRAIACNIGSMHANAESIYFIREGVEIRPGSISSLLAGIADPSITAVQPLITDTSGVVLSAGFASITNSLSVPLFRGLADADARRHSGENVDALSPAAFLVRSDIFAEVGRLNPIFEGEAAFFDFFSRVARLHPGGLRVDPRVVAVDHEDSAWEQPRPLNAKDTDWLPLQDVGRRSLDEHYEEIGLKLQGLVAPQHHGLQPTIPLVTRTDKARRWAIKIGADFTPGGDRWGDVPYASDLARALRAQGQQVVIDRANAFTRPSNYLDDVVLVIRGLHPCIPQPGKINVLWVISRPDLITREEVQAYDIVYAASRVWCEHARKAWGINAMFLPQATNPARFFPSAVKNAEHEFDLAFVGGPRKPIGRKVVSDCVNAGYPVSAWGARWAQFIPEDMVMAEYIDNDELVNVYQSSRIVLNDHFADMAAWGFVNNRLFDAVASGARVISDRVDGIEELFMGAVQTYEYPTELAGLISDLTAFPSDDDLCKISTHIRENHNFDRRALEMINRVETFSEENSKKQ